MPQKRNFLVEIFQKKPKNAVFRFFSKICLQRRKFGQIRVFKVVVRNIRGSIKIQNVIDFLRQSMSALDVVGQI